MKKTIKQERSNGPWGQATAGPCARSVRRTTQQLIAHAEAMSGQHLGNYNEEIVRGDTVKAERSLEKSQYWLDRANDLRGLGEG